jgi:hypothetical protein
MHVLEHNKKMMPFCHYLIDCFCSGPDVRSSLDWELIQDQLFINLILFPLVDEGPIIYREVEIGL